MEQEGIGGDDVEEVGDGVEDFWVDGGADGWEI
jgi:hypothetical protein